MSTFKMVNVVGTSSESCEKAISGAIRDASASLRNISWFEVKEIRGSVASGEVAEYQVKLQLGFKVETGSGQG